MGILSRDQLRTLSLAAGCLQNLVSITPSPPSAMLYSSKCKLTLLLLFSASQCRKAGTHVPHASDCKHAMWRVMAVQIAKHVAGRSSGCT